MISDLRADGDLCRNCGCLLHKHYGGKRRRRVLREWDNDAIIATLVDIRCGHCNKVNTIFYMADGISAVSTPRRKGRFASVAAA